MTHGLLAFERYVLSMILKEQRCPSVFFEFHPDVVHTLERRSLIMRVGDDYEVTAASVEELDVAAVEQALRAMPRTIDTQG